MNNFKELNLSAPLMTAIEGLGYEKPSPIQTLALPILLGEPTDFVGLAATGTGKTAAFGIPLLEKLPMSARGVQAIILCPTRELALQVAQQLNILGKAKNIQALPIYGGASYGDQMHGLKRGDAIVVGTPGRVIDHIERGTLKLDKVTTVVLDEADEMISMGFKEDLDKILESVSKETSNIWLFSATFSREVRRVAETYLRKPRQVEINRTEVLSNTVEQLYYVTREQNKPEIICKLIDAAPDFFGIIFCQTKVLVTELTQYLSDRGYKVDSLHGDKSQIEREKTMRAFRERKVNMIVCTDVAARGLDVKDVTHVINYSLPRELDNYVHRIGRTARSGKSGFALNLVTPAQRGLLALTERVTKSKMKEGVLPTRRELAQKKLVPLLDQFKNQINFSKAIEVLGSEWKTFLETMSAEEIAARFLCMKMPELFSEEREVPKMTFSNARDAEPRDRNRGGRDRSHRRGGGGRFRGHDRRSGGEGARRFGEKRDRPSTRPLN
jgi:ATP-dependent RNA helicase DeaD